MTASSVRLLCPNLQCRVILSVPASARGKTVRCRTCGIRVQVPAPKTSPQVGSAAPGFEDAAASAA